VARQRLGQKRRRHPLSPRHQQIRRPWFEVPEDGNGAAQISILLCGLLDPRQQAPPLCAAWYERVDGLAMPLQKRRCACGSGIRGSTRRLLRAAKEEISYARQGRGDHNEWAVVRGDERRRAIDGGGIGE